MTTNGYVLIHHGIKGQKWGVRRFQNEDGSYKNGAEGRYYDGDGDGEKKKKSKHEGETDQEKKLRIARNVAIGVAATAAVLGGAYLANKYLTDHKDLVIKGGETMQRITTQEEGANLYDNFYAAVGDHDKQRYRNFMPAMHLANKESGQHLMKTLEAKEELKVASPANAKKVFEKLKKEDTAFENAFRGSNYDSFNQNIVAYRHNANQQAQFNKFREAMKEAGYAGVIDVNDRKYSGYGAKNPAIIFDSGKAAIQKMENIDRMKMNDAPVVKEIGKAQVEALFNDTTTVVGGLAVTGFVAGNYANNANKAYNRSQDKRKREESNG